MNIIIFGATGMVGQGVLRECLLDPDVETVLAVGRTGTGQRHERLREIVHADLFDLSAIKPELSGYDACFFCLGVSSAGMTEESYRRVTYDLTMAVARFMAKLNPQMTFIYVSGKGADSTGHRRMWARVKGTTENALRLLPFKAVYLFRPALIVPLHRIKSKTKLYRVFYTVMGPVLPWFSAVAPRYVSTTAQVGRAMLAVAKRGASRSVLENSDINNA